MLYELSDADYDILLRYRSGPVPACPEGLSPREGILLERKYIEPHELTCSKQPGLTVIGTAVSYRIMPLREDALAEFEKKRQDEAKKERQQRFENKVSIANILVPVITFVLGIVVEYLAVCWNGSLPF